MVLTKIEIILFLAFYYLDNGKDITAFAAKYNRYFKKDSSAQTVLYYFSIFKHIDPSNNYQHNGKDSDLDVFADVWKEYIEGEKLKELKDIYRKFKNDTFSQEKDVDIEDAEAEPDLKNLNDFSELILLDSPVPVPPYRIVEGKPVFPRSPVIVSNALRFAEYRCEASCETKLFVRKGTECNYTEAHHLVPLSFQSGFHVSLDVEANVVSLCPNCHSFLHYGRDKEALLWKLYSMRENRLKKCGIEISFEELLLLYR